MAKRSIRWHRVQQFCPVIVVITNLAAQDLSLLESAETKQAAAQPAELL